MNSNLSRFAVLLVVITLIAKASPQAVGRPETESSGVVAWAQFVKSMEKMHVAMNSSKSSGDSDVDFVHLMVPHHQAAIEMAKTEILYGKDPQMRRLAQEIITDQQSETELMQLWMKQREAKSQD